MKIDFIDNFLESEDFIELNKLLLKKVNKDSIKVYHNSIAKDKVIKSECIPDYFLKKLNNKYHKRAIEILKKINKKKVDLYDYSEFHIIESGSHFSFPIHDDTPNKLLSGVIYLRPKENCGTNFYDTKSGKNKRTIEWKCNRAIFFSRLERETWHSYNGDQKSNRVVLVYNLMTNRVKQVYKVEKKSYFIGSLRYKLNPYLYKFFKKTL